MKSSNFQIIIMVVFIFAGIIGLLVFSGKLPIGRKGSEGSGGTVVLWGTAKSMDIIGAIETFNKSNPNYVVKYVQKSPDTYNDDLVNALASGVGPDLYFLPNDLAYSYKSRITRVPYSVFPINAYKSKFASAGDIFLTSQGILAFPISVDPLVMYYNRTILDANGIVYPPTYWDEFPNLVSTLTKRDSSNNITSTAVALGQFSNITNAKDIISTLFMQSGNPIVSEQNGSFTSTLSNSVDEQKLSNDLDFYTEFSDPLKNTYSWNRSLQNSKDAFSAETLAFYFGYASELQSLLNKNPNENFAVAPMPQFRNSNTKITSAIVTGIAVSSFSKNFNSAFTVASLMSTSDFAAQYAKATGTVPVRRDLLAVKPTDEYSPVFYDSALYGKSWLDPSPTISDSIFDDMINSILSNRLNSDQALKDANNKLSFSLANSN